MVAVAYVPEQLVRALASKFLGEDEADKMLEELKDLRITIEPKSQDLRTNAQKIEDDWDAREEWFC